MKYGLCILSSLLMLASCSPDPDKTPKIAESQRQALEKAKGVDATVNQQAEEQRKQVDEQSQ